MVDSILAEEDSLAGEDSLAERGSLVEEGSPAGGGLAALHKEPDLDTAAVLLGKAEHMAMHLDHTQHVCMLYPPISSTCTTFLAACTNNMLYMSQTRQSIVVILYLSDLRFIRQAKS